LPHESTHESNAIIAENIPSSATEDELRSIFQMVGEIEKIEGVEKDNSDLLPTKVQSH